MGDPGSIPGSGRSPRGRNGNPLQDSCLQNPHGQRSLAGYSPWGHKEPDMTERLHFHFLSLFFLTLEMILSPVTISWGPPEKSVTTLSLSIPDFQGATGRTLALQMVHGKKKIGKCCAPHSPPREAQCTFDHGPFEKFCSRRAGLTLTCSFPISLNHRSSLHSSLHLGISSHL